MLVAVQKGYFYSSDILHIVKDGREARRRLKTLLSEGLLIRAKMNNGGAEMWRYSIPSAIQEKVSERFCKRGLSP